VHANTKLQNAHEFDTIGLIRDKSHWTSTMRRESPLPQNRKKSELTCIHSLLVWLSRAKRDSFTLECVLRTFWDCKLAQFCPA